MADIQEYSVSIKFETKGADKAASDADKINKSISGLKSGTGKLSALKTGFGKLGSAVGTAGKTLKLISGVGAIAGLVKLGKGVVNLGQQTVKLSQNMSDYIETVNLFRVSMGSAAEDASKFVNTAESLLGLDPSSLMNSLASFQNLSEGFGIASDRAYIMSQNLTQLAGDLSSFANISFDDAQKKLMSGFSGQVMPLRKYGIALDQASLQETAYSLGIQQRVKTMTRAQKTELIYYQIMKSTSKMQGDLSRTLMSPANALRVLQTEFKQLARAVGSIFIPIIQKIIPIMRVVTKALTQAASAVASFFGFNIENYTVNFEDIEDSLGGISDDIDDVGDSAEGTAKKLNKMLMPFDELNNITSSNASGSGTGTSSVGGGSLGIDLPTYDMFEGLDDRIQKFGNILEKAKEIAHKINELLNGINWGKLQETAHVWGQNIGELINIGINNISWRTVGETEAQGINTVFSFLQDFLHTVDFTGLGYQISEIIEGFFETVDWATVGDTLGTAAEGALETMCTFIEEFDGDVITDALITMITNIKWDRILNRLSKFGLQLVKAFAYITGGFLFEAWDNILNDIVSSLNSIEITLPDWLGGETLKPFDIGYIPYYESSYMHSFDEMIDALDEAYYHSGESVKEAKDVTVKSFEEMEDKSFKSLDKIEKKTDEFGFFVKKTFVDGSDTISNYNDGLESQANITSEITENISEDALKKLDKSNKTKELGINFFKNYNNGLKSEQSETIKNFDKIKLVAQESLNLGNQSNEWGTTTINNYNTGIENQEKNTKTVFGKINNIIQEKLNQAEIAKEYGLSTGNAYNEGVENTQSKTAGIFDKVRQTVQEKLNQAESAKNLGSQTVTGYKEGFEQTVNHFSIVGNVKEKFRTALGSYSEAHKWGSDMATGFKDGFEAKKQEVIDNVTKMAEQIKRLIHFSRPDEGPLRDYETWMPDMVKGLSDSLVQATPILENAVQKITEVIAESFQNIGMPDIEKSLLVNQNATSLINNIGNRTNNASKDNVTTNMIKATYEAVSRALSDNTGNNDNRQIIVNVGNKELYRGYGQFQDEQSNMLGVNV